MSPRGFKYSSNVIDSINLEIKQVAVWEQGEISGRKITRNDCTEAKEIQGTARKH